MLNVRCSLLHTAHWSHRKLSFGHEAKHTQKVSSVEMHLPYLAQSGAEEERLIFQHGNIPYISALTIRFYFPESALKIMLTFMVDTL